MPDASTVKMHLDTETVSVFGNTDYFVLREDGPVQSVFHLDNFSQCAVELDELQLQYGPTAN